MNTPPSCLGPNATRLARTIFYPHGVLTALSDADFIEVSPDRCRGWCGTTTVTGQGALRLDAQ